MSDYKSFKTQVQAQEYIGVMRGWDSVVAARIYLPDHWAADRTGSFWVIEITQGNSDPIYLRQDGYVR